MREIKFRIGFTNHAPIIINWNELLCGDWLANIIMDGEGGSIKYKDQFTGLKDKNGVEIYEGDILNSKTTFENNMADRRFQSQTQVIVGFKNGSFVDTNTDTNLHNRIYSIVSHNIDYEVIGNIHENPELLK